LTWKFQISLIILQTCVEVAFVLHQSNVFKQSWKHYEYIKSCVLPKPHEYVIRVATFFQCALLIELNVWGWMISCHRRAIKALQEGKMKAKKVAKKGWNNTKMF